MLISPFIQLHLSSGKAVVAVESTILTHGLSYPRCLQLIEEIEQAIIAEGAIPAVIAMIDGEIRIGLDHEQLTWLAQAPNKVKLTMADLGAAVVNKSNGGTTAATTVWIANQLGIKVALAGGLGGVHRDVNQTWDISGDLTAIAESSVMLVCGGIKTFLDVGKSLEALETLGVPTWSYQSDSFPGYFVKDSGYKVHAIASADEGARIAKAHWGLGIKKGIVLGVALPDEFAFDPVELEEIITEALSSYESSSGGKGVTPHIIKKIEAYTKGRSGEVNQALIVQASKVASQMAVSLAK